MPAPSLPVTAVFTSLASLFGARLSLNVTSLRYQNRISLGSGGHEALEKAIRAFGNYSEYAPLMLLQLACLELNGAPRWLLVMLGSAGGLGRVCHLWGITDPSTKPRFEWRRIGMVLTIWMLRLGALANVVFALKVAGLIAA